MNESTEPLGFARVPIRTALAAGIALVIGAGVFGVGDAWAAPAEVLEVLIKCPAEKKKKVTLRPGQNTIYLRVANCFCRENANQLKQYITSNANPVSDFAMLGIQIKPGETIKKTIYCYTREQLLGLTSSGN